MTAVSLSRGSCFGRCPVYRITLSRTGRAAYVGHESVERLGRYRGTVEPDRFDDLVRIILRLGFADLDREYPPPGTDLPTYELTLWTGRRPRRVRDDGSAPPELWAMMALVDAVADEVYWEPVRARGTTTPFRYFITRAAHPGATALLRLDPSGGLAIWAPNILGWSRDEDTDYPRWLATGWPSISRLTVGSEFVEIDADEAETMKPLMETSPTLWVNPER